MDPQGFGWTRIWIRIEEKSWIRIRIETTADPKTARATVNDFLLSTERSGKKRKEEKNKGSEENWNSHERSHSSGNITPNSDILKMQPVACVLCCNTT
jgi:hypothetical protein